MPKYAGMSLRAQVDAYLTEGMPDNMLWAGGVIARRHDDDGVMVHPNILLGLKWYHECRRWSPQDQISLPYVLWKLGIEPAIIPGNIYETPYMKHIWTGPSDSGVRSTGYWRASDAHEHHGCSPRLAAWIANYLGAQKDKLTYDLGCGTGYYLTRLKEAGYSQLVGLEGEPPDRAEFSPIEKQDLTSVVARPPGNVICLEVGEHVPAEHEKALLDTITSYCDSRLILSWAIRGQGGRGHVNCLDNHEVIARMQRRGFIFNPEDSMAARMHVDDNTPWFRNTLMIFERDVQPAKINHFYQTIPGYFTFPDFYRWLAREFPEGRGVEIGSFAGRSAAFLAVELHNNAGARAPRLDLVDMFTGIYMAGYTPGEKQIRADLAPVAHIIGDVHSMQSWDAAEKYADGSLDFVYIDADHHYDAVCRDIDAWLPKVRSGGIIAGHDFCNYPGFGVIEAVMERFDRVDVWRGERFFGDGVRSFEDPQQFGGTPGQFFPSWCVRL